MRWLDLGGEDESRYETWEALAPNVFPGRFTRGAGLGEGQSAVNMQYSIPLTTMADRPVDEVRVLLQHIDENYPAFRGATADARNFHRDVVLMTPMVVPFHAGAVEFFERVGRWTPGLQARNEALLEREQLMMAAWPDFWQEHQGSDDPARQWYEWKSANLPELPAVDDDPGGIPAEDVQVDEGAAS